LTELADKAIQEKTNNQQADTTEFETNLDKMIYELYDLTEEEIKIVEGNG